MIIFVIIICECGMTDDFSMAENNVCFVMSVVNLCHIFNEVCGIAVSGMLLGNEYLPVVELVVLDLRDLILVKLRHRIDLAIKLVTSGGRI